MKLHGPRRVCAAGWVWLVWLPIATIGYFAAWAVAWWVRAVTVASVLSLIATAVTRIPFVNAAAQWSGSVLYAVWGWWLGC